MSVRNLEYLFAPGAIAVVGASTRPRSVGAEVMRNLLAGNYAGPVMPVNPKYRSVAGVLAYPDLVALPVNPDLVVVCTPAATVPGIIEQAGRRGARAAIVLSAGLRSVKAQDGRSLEQAMLDAARPYLLRILGPNCLGMLRPAAGLNASFAHVDALPGSVALIHQSGALCTALLDWASSNGVGFSHFVSIGDSADVDFGDVLDFLGSEPSAQSILMYVESIKHARKFMSAARAAARNKPVVVIKAGRVAEGARAAASHTGAMTGSDDVYDAAFRRAGMLRVFETAEMFDAVETLSHVKGFQGERLAILTNGGGPGVMATDALVLGNGRLAELSADTRAALDGVLPATWSGGNPVDIIGDADGARYARALEVLAQDPGVDAVLVLHSPTAVVDSVATGDAVIEVSRKLPGRRPVILTSWLGGDTVEPARRRFAAAGIPSYETPDGAVRAFAHIVNYRRNQEQLMEIPPSLPEGFSPDTRAAQGVIREVLETGRNMLTEPEAKAVLAAYEVEVVETRIARDAAEGVALAQEIGFPVAVKILCPDITHKSDVGGVVLDLETPQAVAQAIEAMGERLRRLFPEARCTGFTVQAMARRPRAYELIVGAATDPIFGPVILFGHGGTAVEVIADRAVALPPLNMKLARELVAGTRVSRLLAGYRDRSAVDMDALCETLIKVSQLIADLAEIVELDINPLFADEDGVLALDARIRVRPATAAGPERLAIRPYPRELEECIQLDGRQMLLRPIRPEDEPQHAAFVAKLDADDIRFRFFGQVRELPHSQMARFTQIDYDREMAFIASGRDRQGRPETLGVVRAITDSDNEQAEFAIVVSSALKGKGLGRALMEKLIEYCRGRGTRGMIGQVLSHNERMLGLAKHLGFTVTPVRENGYVEVALQLNTSR